MKKIRSDKSISGYRIISILVAVIMLLSLMAGCGQTPDSSTTTEQSTTQQNTTGQSTTEQTTTAQVNYGEVAKFLSIGANPIGQTAYTWAAGIADALNKAKLGMSATAEETKGFPENARLMIEGEIETGFVNNMMLLEAYEGIKAYDGMTPNKVLGIMSIAATEMHVFTIEGSSVESVYDLKGKRVGMGQPGGIALEIAKIFIKSLGYQDGDFQEFQVNLAEQCNMLRDGQLDVAIWIGSQPLPAITELAATKSVKLIPVPEEAVNKLSAEFPVFEAQTIPANTYNGQPEEVPTFGLYSVLAANADVSNETVYLVTKTIMENLDTLSVVHPSFGNVTKESILKGIVSPLHPGALRYYEEIGVKTDD